MHYKNGRIKVQIGLAKGKKQYDKREAEKEKDWKRHQSAVMKAHNKKV
jgi:SsrA-binding protein